MRVGFIVALPQELRTLTRIRARLGESIRLSVNARAVLCGMGPQAAGMAAGQIAADAIDGLISWGCAGAVDARWLPGTLVIPAHVTAESGDRLSCDASWRSRLLQKLSPHLTIGSGDIQEVSRVLSEPGEKRAFAAANQTVAVDMESAAIGRVAESHGLRFLVLRAIADTADARLPSSLIQAMEPAGSVRLSLLLTRLARRPREFRSLIRLYIQFRAARNSLTRTAEIAGDELGLGYSSKVK